MAEKDSKRTLSADKIVADIAEIDLNKLRRYIFLVLYLAVWVFSAFVYKYFADSSDGASYIFQQDIKTKNQVDHFCKSNNISLNPRYLIKLFQYPDQRPYFKDLSVNNVVVNVLLDDTLGADWANYYQDLLKSQGFMSYYIDNIYLISNPLTDKNFLIGDIDKQNIKYKQIYKCRLSLYKCSQKANIIIDKSNNKTINVEKDLSGADKTIELWLAVKPATVLVANDFIPISYLGNELKNSVNYIDGSRDKIKSVVEGKYKYPIIDFLYFSAVTITTLGYGDILPNSSAVRITVMIESLLGIIIIGCFLSSLAQKRNDQ